MQVSEVDSVMGAMTGGYQKHTVQIVRIIRKHQVICTDTTEIDVPEHLK